MSKPKNLILVWLGAGILIGSLVLAFLTNNFFGETPLEKNQNWSSTENVMTHSAAVEFATYALSEQIKNSFNNLNIGLSQAELQAILELLTSSEFLNSSAAEKLRLLIEFLNSLDLEIFVTTDLIELLSSSAAKQLSDLISLLDSLNLETSEIIILTELLEFLLEYETLVATLESNEYQYSTTEETTAISESLTTEETTSLQTSFQRPASESSNSTQTDSSEDSTQNVTIANTEEISVILTEFTSSESTEIVIGQTTEEEQAEQNDSAELLEQITNDSDKTTYTTSTGLILNLNDPMSISLTNEDGSSNVWTFESADDPDLTAVLAETAEEEEVVISNATAASYAEKPRDLQMYDEIYGYADEEDATSLFTEVLTEVEACTAEDNCSTEQKQGASFVYSLLGDYETAADYAAAAGMTMDNSVSVSGLVTDDTGNTLADVTISLLSDPSITTKTNADGSYEITFLSYDLAKERLKANLTGYSEGVINFDIVGDNEYQFTEQNFILIPNLAYVTLDLANQTATSSDPDQVSVVVNSDHYLVTTPNSEYQIEFDVFVDAADNPYSSTVMVYVFEFNDESELDNILANDAFNEAIGYANGLITYGMPLLAFLDEDQNVIHIKKYQPLNLTYKTFAKDNIPDCYAILATLQELSADSTDLFIDSEFLANENIDFPTFWIFDFTKGTWDETAFRINDEYQIETIFYTKS